MDVIVVYVRLYWNCLAKSFRAIAKNPWTLLLPMGLLLALSLLGGLLGGLGFLGGILLALAFDALASCYLYFVGEVVAESRVSLNEFRRSIGAYFWSILNLNFVFFIGRLLIMPVLRSHPKGELMAAALELILLIALNAVPEVIYQKGTAGGLATIQQSLQFLQNNWFEWLIPFALSYAAYRLFQMDWGFGIGGLVVGSLVGGAFAHVVMVFRGFVFAALDGSSHRQRMFKFRNA